MAVKSNGGSDAEDNDDEAEGNERKRRDGINEKIQELLTLIPGSFFQVGKEPKDGKGDDEQVTMKSSGTKDGKPNKGQILTSSVEYIQHLQNVIDQNNRKETELLLRLQSLSPNSNVKLSPTSAELALGEIGVGNESDEYFKSVLLKALSRPGRRASLGWLVEDNRWKMKKMKMKEWRKWEDEEDDEIEKKMTKLRRRWQDKEDKINILEITVQNGDSR